jgi:WD40 repeat protein
MTTIRKRFNLNWIFEAPEAVLTCSVLKCGNNSFLVFGGHDKTLYLMDMDMQILDSVSFDGWCRCSYTADITGDNCDEILVGAGDGNFLVLKFVKGINKLATIMNYRCSGKVLCVTAGDFTNDENIELILGGEDKTLKIFKDIGSKKPLYELYYDSWVTSCSLGCLMLSEQEYSLNGLVIGTKNGTLQLIHIKDSKPDILWEKHLRSQINAIDIGDVTNNGFNDVIVGTDESIIMILNANGDELSTIKIEEGRPISLKVADIDGDNANEIIVGCADGSLRIYHNPQLDSSDLELKWKTSTSTSIKIVSPVFDSEQGLINIIYGGYDRSLRCISDYEWGEKEKLEIINNMADIPSPIKEPESLEADEETTESSQKTVPTNLREYIFKILEDKKVLDDVIKELQKMGYVKENIIKEFEFMKTQKPSSYEKLTYSLWTLSEEEIGEGGVIKVIEPKTESATIEENKAKGADLFRALHKEEGKTEEQLTIDENLRYIIIHYLENNNLVPTRTKIVQEIAILGYSEADVEEQVDMLKEQGIIEYSRSEPKGWRLVNQ